MKCNGIGHPVDVHLHQNSIYNQYYPYYMQVDLLHKEVQRFIGGNVRNAYGQIQEECPYLMAYYRPYFMMLHLLSESDNKFSYLLPSLSNSNPLLNTYLQKQVDYFIAVLNHFDVLVSKLRLKNGLTVVGVWKYLNTYNNYMLH